MSEEIAASLPYVHLLQGEAAADVLRATLGHIDALLAKLTPEQIAHKPAPGKWSVRELLCHMADCEVAWAWRLRKTYGEEHPTLQPFEQDPWARAYSGVGYTTEAALATWRALRAWNLALIETLTTDDLRRPAFHPERGELTLANIVEIAAGHDLHHVQNLRKLVEAEAI